MSALSTLVFAWGNPGRRDDGLGPAFAEAIGALAIADVEVESNYQLQVEDAAEVARHRRVLFVDADRGGAGPFSVRRLEPSAEGIEFTSHTIAPGRLLTLSRDLFGAEPEAWLVGIRGYEFDEFGEGLSPGAQTNLTAAVGFARDVLAADGSGGGLQLRATAAHFEEATRG